jgi:SAM-dependent methyltransferase
MSDSNLQEEPVVSVIMPFLNAERFIAEAVESVLAQTYGDWEPILVDDGSTDSSTRIAVAYAAQLPGRITYLDHDGHATRGISASRNAGLSRAKGKFIAFLNPDDLWLPDKLGRQVMLIESHPGASMVYGLTEFWYSWTGNADDQQRDLVTESSIPTDVLYPSPTLLPTLYPLGPDIAPSMSDLLTAREVFEGTGGFEDHFRGIYEDLAFLVKAYLHGSVFVSGEHWVRSRVYPAGLSAAAEAGQSRAPRMVFLNWLETYLDRERVSDHAVRSAIHSALEIQVPKEDVHHKGWLLRAAGHNEADVESLPLPGAPGAMRIVIWKCASEAPWDIQMNLPRLQLTGNCTYRLRFAARADNPRSLSVGVSMAHDPWSGLGLYTSIDVAPDWKQFEFEFVAATDDKNARIHFDIGGSAIALEIASVGLFLEDGSPAVSEIQFGELRRITPISRTWGYDRGVPIDRYYIDKFMRNRAIDVRGRVLEIEDNTYTYRYGGRRVTCSDILHVVEGYPRATIIGDLTNAPHIPDGRFDCIILTQTLQLIYDFHAAIRTLYRILKPGGVLLVTFPGISQNNDRDWSDDWYWSFTPLAARRMFEEAFPPSNLKIDAFGNVLTATSFLQGISAGELSEQELDHVERGYEVTIGVRAIKDNQPR